jgi:uncharacterized protein (TIGR02145 family)
MNRTILKVFLLILWLPALTGCMSHTVKDVDGNVYKTVKIGQQTWMAENLRTAHYNDGTSIPLVTGFDAWSTLTGPSYCWYNNDTNNKNLYGALYNGYAMNTGKLCPKGWHVPTDAEWVTLGEYLGGYEVAGGKLKETGTERWKSPNTGATNESGFRALPGGFRSFNGSFGYDRKSGYWWSSTSYTDKQIFFWNIRYKYGYLYKTIEDRTNGFCIRCVMDQ